MQLPTIHFDEEITALEMPLTLGCLLSKVAVAPSGKELNRHIAQRLGAIVERMRPDDVHEVPAIAHTRRAYKLLGKDPSRYRPSAEALRRRVLQGKGLYPIHNVVDSLNLVSVQSGISIGGYDAEKIKGAVRFGRGGCEEPYEAIGRGLLNVEGLPVLRDDAGAFGGPTSDSVRTSVTPDTRWFLGVFFGFNQDWRELEVALREFAQLLEEYAAGITEAIEYVGR